MLNFKLNIDNFAWPVFVIFVITKAFAGPLGIIFPLIRFLPIILMLLLIAYKLIVLVSTSMKAVMMCAIIILYIVIGMYYKSLVSSLFGFYIFIPLFFSLLFANELIDKIINNNFKFSFFLFITCAIGVIYVDKFGAPWIGMEQEFGGVTKSISKAWSSDGIIRNPGFTSGSVSAAGIMLIVTAQLGRCLVLKKRLISYCILFFVSFYIIYLTTTKTMIYSLVMVMILLCLPSNLMRWGVKITAVITTLISYFYMFGDKPLGYAQYDNTLLIRMYSTWPNAIGILDTNISILFGKGFGSIGTPSYFFYSKFASPADNMYVYLYVMFGLLSVLIIGLLLFTVLLKKSFSTLDDKLFYIILFIIFNGAVTYNLIESSIYAIYGGVIAGYVLLQRKRQ